MAPESMSARVNPSDQFYSRPLRMLKFLPGAGPNGQYTIVLGDCMLLSICDCSQYALLDLEVFVLQKVYMSASPSASRLHEMCVSTNALTVADQTVQL